MGARLDGKAQGAAEREHAVIVRQHIGDELPDAAPACVGHETLHQEPAQALSIHVIAHDQGELGEAAFGIAQLGAARTKAPLQCYASSRRTARQTSQLRSRLEPITLRELPTYLQLRMICNWLDNGACE